VCFHFLPVHGPVCQALTISARYFCPPLLDILEFLNSRSTISYFLKWVIESTLCVLNVDLIDSAYILGAVAPCPLLVYGSYGE